MSVELYRHTWGAVGPEFTWATLHELTRDAAAEGYAGVEFPFGDFDRQPGGTVSAETEFREALTETGLTFMPLISTSASPFGDYDGHLASFKAGVERAKAWGVTKACVHAGADSFDDAATLNFHRETMMIARDAGIEPFFEIHRTRPMYNPFRTVKLLEAIPDMWLTADFAHWLPVLERLPYDLADEFAFCCERTAHIHARVGYSEGSQVLDPRDPVWDECTALHESWWDMCVAGAEARGESIAITPEFGPFPFVLNYPHTNRPISNVDEIVAWMRDRLRARYM